jgi:hypothetical protein
MAVTQSKQAGTIAIGKGTLAQPYIGVIPLIDGSLAVANLAAAATLTPTSTSVVYLTGFDVTGSGASAKNPVAISVNGLLGGPRYYAYMFDSPVNAINVPLSLRFDPPLQGAGIGIPVVVSCPPSGSGGIINVVNAYGYASTPSPIPVI